MATSRIKIEAAKILEALHKNALDAASKKVKDIEFSNGLVDGSNSLKFSIKQSDKNITKSKAKTFLKEYFTVFAGKDVASSIKDSDIDEDNEAKTFNLKIDSKVDPDDLSSVGGDSNSAKTSSNGKSEDPKLQKRKISKGFLGFLGDEARDVLKVLRSVQIQSGDTKIPIGKMLFGTTHDINDTKTTIQDALNKEFQNNHIDYNIFNSDAIYNLLVAKYKVIDAKDPVCSRLKGSKYTFTAKVYEHDPNYSLISKETFADVFDKAMKFKPSIIHVILDYNMELYKTQNKNAKNIINKTKTLSAEEKQKAALVKKFFDEKAKLEKKSGGNQTDELESLKAAVLKEYKALLNKKYKETIEKNQASDDFDKDQMLNKFKSELTQKLKDFEEELDGGAARKDDTPDLYVIPLTSKTFLNKIRNSFDASGHSSDSDMKKGDK